MHLLQAECGIAVLVFYFPLYLADTQTEGIGIGSAAIPWTQTVIRIEDTITDNWSSCAVVADIRQYQRYGCCAFAGIGILRYCFRTDINYWCFFVNYCDCEAATPGLTTRCLGYGIGNCAGTYGESFTTGIIFSINKFIIT